MNIIDNSKKYCLNILNNTKCSSLPFHNRVHTEEVVNQVKIIGKGLGLSDTELEPVVLAAWFHDLGFSEQYNGHEEVSTRLAKGFLAKNNYSSERIETAISCIAATKMPQKPENKYAEILADADLFHLSTDNFYYRKLLLRKEWELYLKMIFTDLEWHKLNLKFLQEHKFFTSYGKEVLAEGQKKNERKVLNLIELNS